MATISAVLYANQNHPELKVEYPNWTDRCKQILKKWRALNAELKAPYLQRARDNRSAIRTKKAQQVINTMTVDNIRNIIRANSLKIFDFSYYFPLLFFI